MLNSITKMFSGIFGSKSTKDMKIYEPVVQDILEAYERLDGLSDDELRNKTIEFREIIAEHLAGIDEDIKTLADGASDEKDFMIQEELYDQIDELKKERDKELEVILKVILPEAFAVVKETARRFTEKDVIRVKATQHDRDLAIKKKHITIDGDTAIWATEWDAAGAKIKWEMIHYDVQLIGGMVLHDGKIAEMQTGEGKTLVATLPAYLNGLSGQGVHVVTVNDYLARRDCEWIGPIFEFLFLSIDCIDKYKPHSPERIEAYKCDIVYGTNSEFGFDYLRDNMSRSIEDLVQRKHHFVMIDEVDSVLIDDARTPLIISGPVAKGAEALEYTELKPKVEKLVAAQKKLSNAYLTKAKALIADGNVSHEEDGGGMALLRAHHALPKNRPLIKFLSQEGVKSILEKTENFYMAEQSKNMHLVDDDMFFVIDEKNRQVDLTDKGSEFISAGLDDRNSFILPDITSEIMQIEENAEWSESDKNDKKEVILQEFSIKTQRLHAISQLLKAYTLFEKDEEYVVVDNEVKIVDEQTGRMMDGRRYSDGLHQALEAKENVKIGNLTQTYATVTLQNYFRMYHKLCGMTGTAETEAGEFWEIYKLDVVVIPTNRPIQRKDMDDLVYKTEREKFNAVKVEIEKMVNLGRPVLVGTTSVEISEKLSRMLNMSKIPHNVLNAKQHQREAEIVAEAGQPGKVTLATNMAGRGTDIKINQAVKDAGGLAIIATERHDSRRVDRQLRGRAGRQGDPGSSQFFISLEDKLMRLFHSEKITKMMDRLGHQEGDVIQAGMVTKSIEKAQKRVEENNFGIRKRLLEYDDVMNIQREAIYTKRNNALKGERLTVDIFNMFMDLAESMATGFHQSKDYEGFVKDSIQTFAIKPNIDVIAFENAKTDVIVEEYQNQVVNTYRQKSEKVRNALLPIFLSVKEQHGNRYKRISIPFGDGITRVPISGDIDKGIESKGGSIMTDIEQSIALALIDNKWKEHLRSMDELKESVQSASFEQKDPLVIYKMDAFDLFLEFVNEINREVTGFLSRANLAIEPTSEVKEAKREKSNFSKLSSGRSGAGVPQGARGNREQKKVETVKREIPKVGRNEPCPCGSGKKFKQCHGKS